MPRSPVAEAFSLVAGPANASDDGDRPARVDVLRLVLGAKPVGDAIAGNV